MKGIFKRCILVFGLSLLLLNMGCAERRIVSTCFYDYNDIVGKRIPVMISQAPGVKGVKRIWTDCEPNTRCLCYQVLYKGDINDLTSCLNDKLQVLSIRSFRMEPKGDNRLEVHFDLGYDDF